MTLAKPAHLTGEHTPCQPCRGSLAMVLALTLAEALLALLLASAIERLVAGTDGVLMPLLAATGIAAMAGAALLMLGLAALDFADGPGGDTHACFPHRHSRALMCQPTSSPIADRARRW